MHSVFTGITCITTRTMDTHIPTHILIARLTMTAALALMKTITGGQAAMVSRCH
jgi:hypothetical protein